MSVALKSILGYMSGKKADTNTGEMIIILIAVYLLRVRKKQVSREEEGRNREWVQIAGRVYSVPVGDTVLGAHSPRCSGHRVTHAQDRHCGSTCGPLSGPTFSFLVGVIVTGITSVFQ